MKSDRDFVNTLQDNIRKRGAMQKLISDRAQVEISNKVLDIMRNFIIDDWQSELYHEHQNPADRRYQTIKTYTNKVLDRTGAPAYTWLLALMYICYLFNHMASEKSGLANSAIRTYQCHNRHLSIAVLSFLGTCLFCYGRLAQV